MIPKSTIKCKEFEEKLYAAVCQKGRELYAEALTAWDAELHESRDRKVYRDKGLRQTTLKTLMGEVEYERHVYTFEQDGRKGTVYLLDEAIGRADSGFFSEALLERVGEAVCELPYRKAAAEISGLTGQSMSHTAVWNVTQQLGASIDTAEKSNAAKASRNKGCGTQEAKLLFEEQDGIWLKLQGKDRKKHGKNYEMKMAMAYDGAKKTGKDRYELTNKVVCANFEEIDKFFRRKEGVIAANWSVDEIEVRVLNGDGARWIKRSVDDDTLYQLDPFHRNKAVVCAAPDKNSRKTMFKLLYSNQIEALLLYIDALANSVEDEEQECALRNLHTYFSNNKAGLTGYKQRGIDLPEPPEGKEYRGMGAMESNVFSVIGNRMKGRRRNWSIKGGNNLARILCLKATHKLCDAVAALSTQMPGKYAEEVIRSFSARKISESAGKGWNGFTKGFISPSMPAARAIAAVKRLY